MARVTVEDCLRFVENRYELVHVATQRTRQLYKGDDYLVSSKNRQIVTSLREVASGKIRVTFVAPAVSQDDGDLLPS